MWSRRDFLEASGVALAVCSPLRAGWGTVLAQSSSLVPPVPASWVGELVRYRADCPAIADLAAGELRFQRVKGTSKYFASLETHLQGVLGLLTLMRRDLFASLMEWSERQGRFLPIWHADQVSRKGAWRRKVLIFHPDGGGYMEHRLNPDPSRGGTRRWKTQGRLLDDPLSAFYNWRAGAFGPLGYGRSYQIDTLARKEPLVLRFQTASEEEARRLLSLDPERGAKAYMVKANLEEELQEAIKGDIEGWLGEDWLPLQGRATRVRLIGEATMSLVERGRLPEPELPDAPHPPLARELWRLS
jgi:hypothetical protein